MDQDRRKFLLSLAAGIGGALGWLFTRRNSIVQGNDLPYKAFLPLITRQQAGSKVVHIYDTRATNWTPSSGVNYWDYVNQEIVNQMVDNGLMRMTGAASVAEAWSSLITGYSAGKKIAIKASFNNAFVCGENSGAINGLIQIVNAMVSGMKQIGVQENDIWVFDAIRRLPDYFISGSLYPGVKFYDNGACGGLHQQATFDSSSSSAYVSFQSTAQVQSSYIKVTNVLVNASYLINMPVMKIHGGGISLGFKNHYGSINDPALLHPTTFVTSASFLRSYSPLVDLFKNPNIGPKTVLTVGDGIFSSNYYTNPPVNWSIFGNAVPKSLFFSRDPVAVDCVMADYLRAQWPDKVIDQCYDYLRLANAAGLGAFEKGNPLSQGYTTFQYDRYNQG